MGVAEGLRDVDSVVSKVCKRVPEAFAGGCVFWPIANTINFGLVPATMRVPYLAACGSVWNTFLSWLNAREQRLAGAGEAK